MCVCVWLFNLISSKLILKFKNSLFTNKFMKILCAVQNSSCYNLSCSAVNVVVIFVLFLFWELHISWVVVLTVNRSICVELITFCISEWLAAFSFVISIYFLVPFDRRYKL